MKKLAPCYASVDTKLVTATSETDLHLIGVPEEYHNRPPTAAVFPKRLNPRAEKIWNQMFSESFVAILRTLSVPDQWTEAVKNFLAACRNANIEAFDPGHGRQDNNRIVTMLKQQRRRIVKYLDSANLLEGIPVRGIDRILHRQNNGFTLVVKAKMNLKNMSRGDLINHITSNRIGMIKNGQGEYQHNVNPSARVYINVRGTTPTIRYEIQISEQPYIAGKSVKQLTKEKYGKFVFDKLWKPVVQEIPCRTASGPCKF